MKTYEAPEIKLIAVEDTNLLAVSIGDVDVNVGEGFF